MGPILAAIDFSDATRGVINTASDLARAFAVRLYLLHVAGSKPDVTDRGLNPEGDYRRAAADLFRQEHRDLQRLSGEIKATGVDATALLVQGNYAEKILQEARRLDVSLIVLGTHGHGRLYDLLMGGVSQDVLRSAPCQLVLVPQHVKTLG
jgi:nucleotide-binding universal stress UspA family protein